MRGSNTEKAIISALNSYQRYVVNHVYGDKAFGNFMDVVERVIESNPGITLEYIQSRRLTSDHCGFYPNQGQLIVVLKTGTKTSRFSGVFSRP